MKASEARQITENQRNSFDAEKECAGCFEKIKKIAKDGKREALFSDRLCPSLRDSTKRLKIMTYLGSLGYDCHYEIDDGLDGNMSGDDYLRVRW